MTFDALALTHCDVLCMYAFQATRDHKWLLFGRDVLASLQNTQVPLPCAVFIVSSVVAATVTLIVITVTQVVPCGVAGISDVRARKEGGRRALEDLMPSYFTAETLKYLYLLFTPEHALLQGGWVFNTEAHAVQLPVFLGGSRARAGDDDAAAAAAAAAAAGAAAAAAAAAAATSPSMDVPWFSAGAPPASSCSLPPFWLRACMHGMYVQQVETRNTVTKCDTCCMYVWPPELKINGVVGGVNLTQLDGLHAAAAAAAADDDDDDDDDDDGDWTDEGVAKERGRSCGGGKTCFVSTT